MIQYLPFLERGAKSVAVASSLNYKFIIAAFIVAIMIMIDAASGITKVCVVWAKVIILKVAIVNNLTSGCSSGS